MAAPLPISHEQIRDELRQIALIIEKQIAKMDRGVIVHAEQGEPDGELDPDTILRRFQKEIELAGQRAITLAATLDPELS